jgi:hypothetical protein
MARRYVKQRIEQRFRAILHRLSSQLVHQCTNMCTETRLVKTGRKQAAEERSVTPLPVLIPCGVPQGRGARFTIWLCSERAKPVRPLISPSAHH